MKESELMKTTAIIAEFNPFHNGHKYIADKARENGADCVIAVMSGNWVQRGDSAIISKFARTKQALECGFDLVVELPTYWAMATAQKFAAGALYIIENLGCDTLCFGSECGDITRIMQTVYAVRSKEFEQKVKYHLSSGTPLAKARELVAEELCGNGELLRNPNDTLAIEYISAAKDLNSKMRFEAVKRIAVGHNDILKSDGYCSASTLREMIRNGNIDEAESYMPHSAFDILLDEYEKGKISDITSLEKAIIASLRTSSPEKIGKTPDTSEGIEHRIYNAASMSSNLSQLIETAGTKRYTNARLRRLILAAFLNESIDTIPAKVPYIRVLGCNKTGATFLQKARENTKIPIVMRSTTLKSTDTFDFEAKATDVYSLSQLVPDNSGSEFTNGVIVKR